MCKERDAIQATIQAVLAGELGVERCQYEMDGGREGYCELRWLREADVLVIVCSHAQNNPGVSITNAAPAPWEQAEDDIRQAVDETVVWIEHSATLAAGGQVRHQFERVIAGNGPGNDVKWKALGVHVVGECKDREVLEMADTGPFDVHGTESDRLLFALVQEDQGDEDVEDEEQKPGSSFIQVSASGEVQVVVLPPERATFVDLDEIHPRERAIMAQSLAASHAVAHGVRVDPGVVAVG